MIECREGGTNGDDMLLAITPIPVGTYSKLRSMGVGKQ